MSDIHDIQEAVRRRIEAEREALVAGESEDNSITTELVKQCLGSNELGDAVLFAAINRGQFLFDASSGEWLAWSGHFFERDLTGKALGAVEKVAVCYLNEATALSRQLAAGVEEERKAVLEAQQQRIFKRVNRLRSVRGRKNCLEMAATLPQDPMVTTGEKLDTNPWLLACQNGVVDLRTGDFRPGRPDDFITKAANVDWEGLTAPAPTWEKFLLEVMDDDQSRVDYQQRLLGYGITGMTKEHNFVVYFGVGRNGKGIMLETLQTVLGPLVGPISSDMLLDQGRVRNSSGPSPDIMGLRGLRIAFASETDQGRRFSASRVKWLSGGDTLTGRNPHDRHSTSFKPSHLLILATNFKPKANPDDLAFWARMHLVDFPLSFVERPSAPNERLIDRTLEDRLLEEGPGILAWLVRGCLEYQERGLEPPSAVLAATAQWRRSEDDLADFLEEACVVSEGSSATAKELYTEFKEWFTSNISDKVPSQKKFGDMMARRFKKDNSGPGKTVKYHGIGILNLFGEDRQ